MAQTEICGNGLDDDGDGYIDSYDSDCFTGPVPTCFATAPGNTFGIQLNAQGPANILDVSIAPTIGDIDNDGKVEIIAPLGDSTQGYIVYEVNGTTVTQEPYQYNISLHQPVSGTVSQPAIADLDRNGTSEVICVGADGYIYVFNHTGGTSATYKWRSNLTTDTYWGSPRISDINEDGVPEIIVGNDIFRFNAGMTALNRIVQGSNSNPIGQDGAASLWGSGIVVIDILPSNPGKEIVAGSVVYGVNFTNNTLVILKNLNTINNIVPANSDGPTAVADLDGDGDLDVVYQSRTTGMVYVWDPLNNQLVFSVAGAGVGATTRASEPTVAYVYDDKKSGYTTDLPEIIIVNNQIVTAYNLQFPGNKRIWQFSTTDTSGETGITAFDFNGDGVSEIIYNDETTIRIMNGNTTTPVTLSSFSSGTLTWMEHPVVADVDNDGQAEMVAFTGAPQAASGQGRLNIFNPTAGNVWQPARKVWNQRGYRVVNINDDLTVPRTESSSTKFMPATSTKFKTLNQYNVQFNPDYLRTEPGMIVVPDAQLTNMNYNGVTKNLEMQITVAGSANLPAGTPITIYKGDPRVINSPVVQTLATPAVIPFGTSSTLNFGGVNIFGNDYYIVINDNGSKARPFSLSSDFPSTGTSECNYTNNIQNLSAANMDSDGDGVTDDTDLDDDNDGITDLEECPNQFFWTGPLTFSPDNKTATGTINGVNFTFQSDKAMTQKQNIYNHTIFPASYGIPNNNPSIANTEVSSNTLTFASPMLNPVLVFASVGQPGLSVPIIFDRPVEVLWAGSSNGSYTINSPTQVTGREGYFIIKVPGTISSLSFNYTTAENWANFTFGATQTAACDTDGDGIPDEFDTDSDGDGCPDAVEGTENVRITQVYPLNYPTAGLRGQIKVLGNGSAPGTPAQVVSTVAAASGIPQLVNNAPNNNSNIAGAADSTDTTADAGQGAGTSKLANVKDVECTRCFRPANTSGTGAPSNFGITALNRAGTANGNWPMKITGAHTVLDAKTKGFVVNRVAFTGTPAIPVGIASANYIVGMMVYDTTNNCLKIYDGTGWYCYTQQTCDNLNE